MNPYSAIFYPQSFQPSSTSTSSSSTPPLICPTPKRAVSLSFLLAESAEAKPNSYYTDRLLNFLLEAGLLDSSGKILVPDTFQLPGLTDFNWILDVLDNVSMHGIPLHNVLTTLYQASECSISLQRQTLYPALCVAGYIDEIVKSLGVRSSINTSAPIPPAFSLPLECLITVNDQTALEKMRCALLFDHQLKCDNQHEGFALSFLDSKKNRVILRISLKNPEIERQTPSLDLTSYFSGAMLPLSISIPGNQPLKTLIYSLIGISQQSNWLALLDDYSVGYRSLDPSHEIEALQHFRMSSSPSEMGKACAHALISRACRNQLPNGNEFYLFALQFLCSSQLTTNESYIFLQTISEQLKTLEPMTNPLLKIIHSCAVNHMVPFSMIQNLLELAATHDLHYTSAHIRSSIMYAKLTQHNKGIGIRINFGGCSRSLLVPFNPAVSLSHLNKQANEWPSLEMLYPLYEMLFSQKKSPLEDFKELNACIGNRTTWRLMPSIIQESAIHPQGLLSHLALQLIGDQKLHGTTCSLSTKNSLHSLLKALSLPLHSKTHQSLLSKLPASSVHLPEALKIQLQSLAQDSTISPKDIRKALISGLLSETPDIKVQAYPFWLEEAEAFKQIDRGSELLDALIKQKQWNQALRVLRILSKQNVFSFKDLQTSITQFYQALHSDFNPVEYTVIVSQLSELTLYAFQYHHHRTTFLRPPPSFSTILFKLITFNTERNMPLACDLFLEGVSKKQLIPAHINLSLLGRRISWAMLQSPELTPFAGYFFAFLVRENLWESNQDTAFVCELAFNLIDDPRPEAIPLLGTCLSVLRKETFKGASIKDFEEIKSGIVRRLVSQYTPSEIASPMSSLVKPALSNPKQLAETVAKLIAKGTRVDSEFAYLILTDPSFLAQWIQDPDALTQATLLWTKNGGSHEDRSLTLLMNLLSIVPFDQWGQNESIDCTHLLTHQLEDAVSAGHPLFPSFLTCMQTNHLSIIRHLINLDAVPEAASLIYSLEKHFEKSDWNKSFANTVLESHELSSRCFSLLENLISDHSTGNLQALGDLRCTQAAKAVQNGHFTEGLALADSLLEIEEWHPHSEEAQQQLLLLARGALSETQQIPLAQTLIRKLISPEKMTPVRDALIEEIAEAHAAKKNWNACCRWMVENSQSLSSTVIEKWAEKMLNEGIETQNTTLLKKCLNLVQWCNLSDTLLLSFLKSVSPSNQVALQKEAINIWQTLEEGQKASSSVIYEGWNIILSFSSKALSAQTILTLIQRNSKEEEAQSHSQLAVKSAFALVKVCRQKKKIQKRHLRPLLKSLETVSKEELEGLVIPFVNFLIQNSMPAEALSFCIHTGPPERHFQQISSKLPVLAAMLEKRKDAQPAHAYAALAELADRLNLENIRHMDCSAFIKNLAGLPDDKAYQSACSLFSKHLAVQNQRQFRRSDISQTENILTLLCANANTFSRICSYGPCLDQPFITKHITKSQFRENYLVRLLTESLADRSAPVSERQSSLTSFVDHYRTIEKDSVPFYESFPLAIRLNLSMFLANDGKCDHFQRNHHSYLGLIKPHMMRLKMTSVRGGSPNISQEFLNLYKDMMQIYTQCLREQPLQSAKHYETLYQATQSLFALLLEIRPQKNGYDFLPEFLLFFSPMHTISSELQAQHFLNASTYFQTLCSDKQQIDAQSLHSLVLKLNTGIVQSLSSEALSEQNLIALSNVGFANLKAFFSVVETSSYDGRILYDQMLFALELPQCPAFQNHLEQATTLIQILQEDSVNLGRNYFASRYLYTRPKLPDTAKFSFEEKNQIITEAVREISNLKKQTSHLRVLGIIHHGIHSLSGPHLLQCVHSLSTMINGYTTEEGAEMIVQTAIVILSQYDRYHNTVSKDEAVQVFEEIFSSAIRFCTRVSSPGHSNQTNFSQILHGCIMLLSAARKHGIHSKNPSRFAEMIESLETLIYDSENPILLMMTLEFFLKQLPEAMPTSEQQTRRAQLIERLFIRGLSDKQAKHLDDLIQFLGSFIKYTAVFDENSDCIANIKTHLP
jgi:hypothetical protein